MRTVGKPDANESNCNLAEIEEIIRTVWAKEWKSYMHRVRGVEREFPSTAKWDGGTDAMGRKHKSIWTKAAELCLRHSLDPRRYVTIMFTGREGGDPPFPNVLISSEGLKKFEAFKTGFPEDINRAFEIQQNAARQTIQNYCFSFSWSYEEAVVFTLFDCNVSLSALFRYCLADQELKATDNEWFKAKLMSVKQRWAREAETAYLKWPDVYNEVWGEHIPKELRAKVK